MNEILCDLDCCFRMFRCPEQDLLTEVFIGDPDDARYHAVCAATREEWILEIAGEEDDDCYIGGGGVPYGCPIFQGMIHAPWEMQ